MASPVTFIMVAVPPNIRHAVTRWMIEPAPGVFVGTISAKVRDELWAEIETETHGGWAVLIHTAANEQGFDIRTAGIERRLVIDLDGLKLIGTATPDPLLENRQGPPQDS
jgi:CRISPR-associated protein Cas2